MNDWFKESYASEDALCEAFHKNLLQRRDLGMLRPCVFFHIANQQVQTGKNSAAHMRMGAKMKRMGKRAGVLDYEFIWKDQFGATRIAFLEAKMPSKSPSKEQQDFMEDCKALGIPVAVFRSVQEGLRHLEDWGLIKPQHWS